METSCRFGWSIIMKTLSVNLTSDNDDDYRDLNEMSDDTDSIDEDSDEDFFANDN